MCWFSSLSFRALFYKHTHSTYNKHKSNKSSIVTLDTSFCVSSQRHRVSNNYKFDFQFHIFLTSVTPSSQLRMREPRVCCWASVPGLAPSSQRAVTCWRSRCRRTACRSTWRALKLTAPLCGVPMDTFNRSSRLMFSTDISSENGLFLFKILFD